MARADASSKALIKAAIRSKCHVLARRYPEQNLDQLHGSNGKWLILCDELYEEVCTEFTVRKLEMEPLEKRALFDAEWISQVTYELVTKPARPKRRNANRANLERASCSAEPASNPLADPPTLRDSVPSLLSTITTSHYSREGSEGLHQVGCTSRSEHVSSEKLVTQTVISRERERDQPAWYRTVMN